MFIVTHRDVDKARTDPAHAFSSKPSPERPNGSRVAWAERKGGRWRVLVLPGEITDAMAQEVGLPLPSVPGEKIYASRYVSRKLQRMVNPAAAGAKGQGTNVLFLVQRRSSHAPSPGPCRGRSKFPCPLVQALYSPHRQAESARAGFGAWLIDEAHPAARDSTRTWSAIKTTASMSRPTHIARSR